MDKETSSMDKETSSMDKETSSMDKETSSMDKETSSMDKETSSIVLPELDLEKSINWIAQSKTCFIPSNNYKYQNDTKCEGPVIQSNWVIPQHLLCGGYLNTDKEVSLLRDAGITKFVCLNSEYGKNSYLYYRYADKLPTSDFIHIPIHDMSITEKHIVSKMCIVIADMILAGETVYVHCSGGHGRTGTFIALILNILYPQLHIDQVFDYIQYAHDHRIGNYFGPQYFARYLKSDNKNDNEFADKFAIGQVPTPQTLEQRKQVISLWK